MKNKVIVFDKETRKKIAAGSHILARAVVSTLGPLSRNVAIQGDYFPYIVHDGVTVAKAIKLKDPAEDMGVQLVKEAAVRTNDLTGDGTTTATLLADTLLQGGFKLISDDIGEDGVIREKVKPMELREELLKYGEDIIQKLEKMAKPIKTAKEKAQIATISAQNSEIGMMVAQALEKVKDSGVVLVEEGSEYTDRLDIQEGMEFDNGFLSPYFMTDPNRMIADYDEGYVLLTDYVITHPDQIVPIIEAVRKDGNKPLIIIAGDVVGPALQTMVMSKMKAAYKLCAIIAPEFGERRRDALDDMALLTGGTYVSQQTGKQLQDVKISDLGRFRKIRVDAQRTTISPANPDKDEIEERIKSIKDMIKKEDVDFKREMLEMRVAKLSQSVAIIRVGGAANSDIKERRERFIDAIYATKAAIAEGVVPGGGVALYSIMLNGEYPDLIIEMLSAPLKTILSNSDADFETVKYLLKTSSDVYDVREKKVVDAYKAGIIDPVKVTKSAVRNAIRIASTILTTDTLIFNDPEEKKD